MKRIDIEPGEAVRLVQDNFTEWLASMRSNPALPDYDRSAPPVEITCELHAILDLQRTREISPYERLGDWKIGGNWSLPDGSERDSDSDPPPPFFYECIGHAGNGDLFCAIRCHDDDAKTNEVWLFNHELGRLTHPVADSIAAFVYLATLDERLGKGPPEHVPDAALEAKEDEVGFDAWCVLVEAAQDEVTDAWEHEMARAFAALEGRVLVPWTFLDVRAEKPVGFREYASTTAAMKALGGGITPAR